MGKIAAIRGMPSPQPSPTGEGAGCSEFCDFGDLKGNLDLQPLISGRLKSKKQPAQPIFLADPLITTAAPSSLPWERARERATSRKACIEVVKGFGKDCRDLGECPLPNPPPRGREQVAADFAVLGGLKSNLNLQPLIAGRLKNKKQPAQPD